MVILLLVLFPFSLAQFENLNFTCDDGFLRNMGHCYKVFRGTPLTWQQANKECEKYGSYLTTIIGKTELEYVMSISATNQSQPLAKQPWMGFYYQAGTYFAGNISYSRFNDGIKFAADNGSLVMKNCVCGKLLSDENTDGDEYTLGQKGLVATVPCATDTSPNYICKKRNCPRATSITLPAWGCKCKDGLSDVYSALTSAQRNQLGTVKGELCLQIP